MNIKYLSLILVLFLLGFVVELTRREKLTFKYASGWLIVCVVGFLLILFDQVLFKLAQFLGFVLPSNFVFFALLMTFVFLSLCLTIFLCQQNNRNDVMAQKIGLLQEEMDQIKKVIKGDDGQIKRE